MMADTEQAFLDDFRDLLLGSLEYHRDNVHDRAAQDFARYLRAARANAGLSRQALAGRSGLRPALLTALELAAVPASTLTWPQLRALAHALGEDVSVLALLLERDLPEPEPAPLPARARRAWEGLVAYLGTPARALTALGLAVAALGGAALAGLLGLLAARSPLGAAPARLSAVAPLRAILGPTGPPGWDLALLLEYVPLTLAAVLLVLLPWYALVKHDLSPKWEELLRWRSNTVVNATSLLLVLVLIVPGIGWKVADMTAGSLNISGTPIEWPRASGPPTDLSGSQSLGQGTAWIGMKLVSVFDSLHLDPIGRVTNRAYEGTPRESLCVQKCEQLFTNIDNAIGQVIASVWPWRALLLMCQSVTIGLLYALMWREAYRAGRLRRVLGPRPPWT